MNPSMSLERGKIFWRKPTGLYDSSITVKGGVGTERLVGEIYASNLDNPTKADAIRLIDIASETVIDLLYRGAILTLNGEVVIKPLPDLNSQQRDRLNLDRDAIVLSSAARLSDVPGLERFHPLRGLMVIDRNAESYLAYRFTKGRGLVFGLMRGDNENESIGYRLVGILVKMIDGMQPMGKQRVIASATIASQTLFDIANTFGKNDLGKP